MPLTSARSIIELVAARLGNDRQQPIRVLTVQPAGVSERNWSIYCRHVHAGETLVAIGTDHGITRERARQIVNAVERVVAEQI
jgi:DNA-directed RNA polymerase sigma subunit (sigma70/sigma32)